MIEIYVTILALLSLGSDGSMLSPESSYEQGFQNNVSEKCRPANTEELNATNIGSRGKASTFNLRGFYVCDSAIYEYGDRNSFYTFVADHANQRATEVALKLSKMIAQRQNSKAPDEPVSISIEVLTDVRPVRTHLLTVFETALVQYAPNVRVLRINNSLPHSKMLVAVRRIDDEKQFIAVSLSSQTGKTNPKQEWIDL